MWIDPLRVLEELVCRLIFDEENMTFVTKNSDIDHCFIRTCKFYAAEKGIAWLTFWEALIQNKPINWIV